MQRARKRTGPFGSAPGRWREIVESHQDLYLPCGVKCLTSLRQSMIIEKITLMALAQAKEDKQTAKCERSWRKPRRRGLYG